MGYGSKIAKTKPSLGPNKSGCFSGGASRNGSIERFYPSQSQDMILSGQGPSKTDPEKNPKSKTTPTAGEIKLNNVAPSGGVKTSNAKDDLRNIINSQQEYDNNTTSVSRELAEKDSLKLVIQGQGKKAHELYSSHMSGQNSKPYTSNNPIPINPYNKSATNQHVLARTANKKRLREEAKKIQGSRPSLGANKKYKH